MFNTGVVKSIKFNNSYGPLIHAGFFVIFIMAYQGAKHYFSDWGKLSLLVGTSTCPATMFNIGEIGLCPIITCPAGQVRVLLTACPIAIFCQIHLQLFYPIAAGLPPTSLCPRFFIHKSLINLFMPKKFLYK